MVWVLAWPYGAWLAWVWAGICWARWPLRWHSTTSRWSSTTHSPSSATCWVNVWSRVCQAEGKRRTCAGSALPRVQRDCVLYIPLLTRHLWFKIWDHHWKSVDLENTVFWVDLLVRDDLTDFWRCIINRITGIDLLVWFKQKTGYWSFEFMEKLSDVIWSDLI